jgi:hypothetical protein
MSLSRRNVRVRRRAAGCWAHLLTACGVALARSVGAQSQPVDPVTTTVVTVDLAQRTLAPSPLPFSRRVVLRGKIPERAGADKAPATPAAVILLRVRRRDAPAGEFVVCESWSNPQIGDAAALVKQTDFEFYFTTLPGGPPLVLAPNTDYDLTFLVGTSNGGGVVPAPPLVQDLCKDPFSTLYPGATLTDQITLHEKTGGTFEDHFKLDLGLLLSDRARYTSAVTDVHLYSIPVDRGGDLGDPGLTALQELQSRLSVFGGLAALRFNRRGTVDAPRDIGALVTGLGLRAPFYGYCAIPRLSAKAKPRLCLAHGRKWLQPMRLNAGLIFLQQQDANPSITDKKRFVDAFLSLTLDTEVKAILGPLGNLFGK